LRAKSGRLGSPYARPVADQPWKRQVPNALTLARLGMAAALVTLLALAPPLSKTSGIQPALLAAVVLFVVAAITDAADGYLARKWQAVSLFGRIMVTPWIRSGVPAGEPE